MTDRDKWALAGQNYGAAPGLFPGVFVAFSWKQDGLMTGY